MRRAERNFLITVTIVFVSGCTGPIGKNLEEASDQGIYQESIREILDQDARPEGDEETRSYDLSGVYLSEITSNHHWYLRGSDRAPILHIRQSGNRIVAFDSTYRIKIEGTIEDDVISYIVYPSVPTSGNFVKGQWIIDSDADVLPGQWQAPSHGAGGDCILMLSLRL